MEEHGRQPRPEPKTPRVSKATQAGMVTKAELQELKSDMKELSWLVNQIFEDQYLNSAGVRQFSTDTYRRLYARSSDLYHKLGG
jgi:hypothetical protein